ncbi:sulfonate ABC transporter substrate-binding protein [Nostoc cf. commune SO-36]|uniref:Sulfonate ABC transporter substrate-binding protein n=1 Tax=Nostoc cf. commune SO-36 TaxID=449208 RepID=A0ABM7Z843_NOSCO|nr:sulfonate ABC transporter substrate-binding protein [Nostoc commune]BDI19354.1 sulfonate ABC transporter substrate-binding protein [Nostoc cf. commune SO-36]
MFNFLFKRIRIYCQKWVIFRFASQTRLLSIVPIQITGTFITGLCLSLLFAACTANNPSNTTTVSANNSTQTKASVVRFGYQKSAILLKSKGLLEKRLQPEGVSVEWIEFPAGPQLLEAMNVGSIDLGHTGESPPIFAQAGGTAITYIAGIAPSPASSAILVSKNSAIKTVNDLKGKKIALQKGSSAHYMLVQILEKYGLKYSDIQPIYLPPADARAAFVRGSIDAWSIWDPFYAAAEKSGDARVLIDGTGINKQGGYYLASQKFASQQQEIIKTLLEEIQNFEQWSDQHRDEVAASLSPILGIDLETMKKTTNRRKFGITPISQELITLQQQVADKFYELKLIPKQINVKEAMLTPGQYAAFSPKVK